MILKEKTMLLEN